MSFLLVAGEMAWPIGWPMNLLESRSLPIFRLIISVAFGIASIRSTWSWSRQKKTAIAALVFVAIAATAIGIQLVPSTSLKPSGMASSEDAAPVKSRRGGELTYGVGWDWWRDEVPVSLPPTPVPPLPIPAAGNPVVSYTDLGATVARYGWPINEAFAVVDCESRWDPLAVSWDGSSYGLWQVNAIHFWRWPNAWTEWDNPEVNTRWAWELWLEQGWGIWSCS